MEISKIGAILLAPYVQAIISFVSPQLAEPIILAALR